MKVFLGILGAVAMVFLCLHLYHQWYVDTHCTEILGTQVCDTGQQSTQQSAPPSTQPASQPTGIYVNVAKRGTPYPTTPGAGPGGTTCSAVSTGMQLCN